MARRTITLPPIPDGPDRPVILVRVYPGYHEQAVELFQIDAETLLFMATSRWRSRTRKGGTRVGT
jgi:hypothetical protein